MRGKRKGRPTVGRLLAQRLGKPFADADDLIVQRSGKSIREIFASGGEETFRKLEMAAIAELAGRNDGVDICYVGGGDRPA